MNLTDNQLAAIVFLIIMFTIIIYRLANEVQQRIIYTVEYPHSVIYVNVIIFFLCLVSIIGLVKLLQRFSRRRRQKGIR